MRTVAGFLLITSAISFSANQTLLHGVWRFQLDPENRGMTEKWYEQNLAEAISLPGSVQEQGYGNDPSPDTHWLGNVRQDEYGKAKYGPYKRPDHFKYPFWLTPKKHYRGAAWFQKQFGVDGKQSGSRVVLELERPHWETRVWVDGFYAGADSSLSTPHRYDLTDLLTPGPHTLTIRVNNDMIVNVGPNAHSVSDHTQSNWNGITGKIRLIELPPVYFEDAKIFPDPAAKSVRIELNAINTTPKPLNGRLELKLSSPGEDDQLTKRMQEPVQLPAERHKRIKLTCPMGKNPLLWDEFTPHLYGMDIALQTQEYTFDKKFRFGMRSIKTKGTRIYINGRPVFLRGTLECAIFPKTGYPPADTAAWRRIFDTARSFGLNHIRFHSWCPPEAAFHAADRCGMYLHVEAPIWANQGASLGDGDPIDRYVYAETRRILDEYGNHPSFCLYACGNEPAGKNHKDFLGRFVEHWRSVDNRRLYTSAAGWPVIAQNDFHSIPEPRIQRWGEGLNSVINAQPPNTAFDFADIIAPFDKPVVSHEIGQWCVYPNFDEMDKYTGVLEAKNFEIFRDFLAQNHMGHLAKKFLMASGKLQTLCYKADIEAALRTPGLAGFQLLDLHDFPGQGTALVGVLDPFWDTKGYVTAKEYRRFCSSTVPLAVMEKRTWKNSETFRAEIQIAHFGPEAVKNAPVNWRIESKDSLLDSGRFVMPTLALDNGQKTGPIIFPLYHISAAQKLTLTVAVAAKGENSWDFWVYPENIPAIKPDTIIQTAELTPDVQKKLQNGATVLLLLNGKVHKGKKIAVGFSPAFWNTVWTGGQAPHTLGILCDPAHPLFTDFPTEFHTNWQWWDILHQAQAMHLEDFPPQLMPVIQLVDTWFEARRTGLLFQARSGDGKIVVTSIEFESNLQDRPAARQLYAGILRYMKSEKFKPEMTVTAKMIRGLYE